ncbi:MAG: DNA mismatch repair protein MutT [Betaproteobacteria bacterium HGW-Betaproteobacteria-1]|jgi:8-oxo-dGTP diphosphatase|nr:MAG: DNA mismatch repair protein MutT [Betaproteobacteria bacterium HGW-Betaproteobacteria-1]
MSVGKVIHAAVAVLQRPDGQVLLGQRPEGKPWAGWWEFPGGKIEEGETALQALQRELHEELGTEAIEATPWLTRSFEYPEKTVKLHFFMVRLWSAEPHGKEGQQLSWQYPDRLTVEPMLPANTPVLRALILPTRYAISNLAETTEAVFLEQLQRALDNGLQLIQVREKQLAADVLRSFARRIIEMCRPYSAKVLLNTHTELAAELGADGVHLTSGQLMDMAQRPDNMWVGASCHNRTELDKAASLGLDFVTLSPVLPTRSHPEAACLGWRQFEATILDYPLPVFAMGGMQPVDLATAWQHGAHGIAMQRGVWTS